MKVDFYVLEVSSAQQAMLFACKLIEQIHALKQKVYIHTMNAAEAERFDHLLWTFKEDSFIPHSLVQHDTKQVAPIQIGFSDLTPAHSDCLINFCQEVPNFYQQFYRIIEIVFNDENIQQLARERFKFYRSNSCDITTHKIKAS